MANKLTDELPRCHLSSATRTFITSKPNGSGAHATNGNGCATDDISRTKQQSDEQLMLLIQAGDHDAFADLFDRYYRLVLSIALRILRNEAEAEDLMQEVFFEIYRKAEEFDEAKGTTKFWIMRYAYSRSLNRARYLSARGFYDPQSDPEDEIPVSQQTRSNWNGLTVHEWARILEQGLAILSPRQRDTIERVCYQGQSMSEIAAAVGETVGNVRNHYYRAIRHLRVFLGSRSLLEQECSGSRAEKVETGT